MEFRLIDFPYPLRILRLRRLLERSQWWSEEQLVEWRNQRLQELVQHAARHVPYYRQLFQTHGIDSRAVRDPADLAALPVLDKDTVREHTADLRAGNAWLYGPRRTTTSGSTGTALSLWLDRPTNVLE